MVDPAPAEALPRVVVVDDSETVRRHTSGALRRVAEVTAVADPTEVPQLVADLHTDVVVADVVMPQMSGIQLIKALREAHRPVGLIILTGRLDEEVMLEALRAGADDFLRKPSSPAAIRESVARVTIRARQRQQAERASRLEIALATIASVSHEVMNPLTGLLFELQILQDDVEDEELRAAFERMEAGAHRIKAVVQRLRSLAEVKLTDYVGDDAMLDLGEGPQAR